VNLPHSIEQDTLHHEIDCQLSNRSVLVRSLYQNRQHFVITLRAKPNALAFASEEVRLLMALSPVICDAIRLSRWLEKQMSDISQVRQQMAQMTVSNEAMRAVAETGCDRWKAVGSAAKNFFGCNQFFLAIFDGRNLAFTASGVNCRFEDCTAGIAYNYRETVFGRESDPRSKFNPELYQRMSVKDCTETLAFPYRAGGKVAGAIEVINPTVKNVGITEQKLFSHLIALLLAGDPPPSAEPEVETEPEPAESGQ
jgi:hypothetical protein